MSTLIENIRRKAEIASREIQTNSATVLKIAERALVVATYVEEHKHLSPAEIAADILARANEKLAECGAPPKITVTRVR
jgi:hypothetical protein